MDATRRQGGLGSKKVEGIFHTYYAPAPCVFDAIIKLCLTSEMVPNPSSEGARCAETSSISNRRPKRSRSGRAERATCWDAWRTLRARWQQGWFRNGSWPNPSSAGAAKRGGSSSSNRPKCSSSNRRLPGCLEDFVSARKLFYISGSSSSFQVHSISYQG